MSRPSTYEKLVGQRRGHLVIQSVRRHPTKPRYPQFHCLCDCGRERYCLPWNLTGTSSCGFCQKRRLAGEHFISYSTPEPEYTKLKAQVVLNNVKMTERGCMEWQGFCHPQKGYGQIGMKDSKNEPTHRVVYRGVRGPIPAGWDICHTCDNPPCCNPLHLFAAPRVANLIDMRNKGRNRQTQKTHCPHGHPYSGENLWIDSRGWRHCKACGLARSQTEEGKAAARERQRRLRAERRAARSVGLPLTQTTEHTKGG